MSYREPDAHFEHFVCVRKLPDIQDLLRRHLYGSTSERIAILAAMSERVRAQAAHQGAEQARQRRDQAAARGLRYVEVGRRDLAQREYAEAKAAEGDRRRWAEAFDKHMRAADALDGGR